MSSPSLVYFEFFFKLSDPLFHDVSRYYLRVFGDLIIALDLEEFFVVVLFRQLTSVAHKGETRILRGFETKRSEGVEPLLHKLEGTEISTIKGKKGQVENKEDYMVGARMQIF